MSYRPKPPPKSERQLDGIYAEIPAMRSCSGACASACGPIVMTELEWKRVIRAKGGHKPKLRNDGQMRCPMLSPTNSCTVYSVRPFICRLWGTTPMLKCPEGCEPERWLSTEEAKAIFERLTELAGKRTNGPAGPLSGDLWKAFALEARQERDERIQAIHQAKQRGEL